MALAKLAAIAWHGAHVGGVSAGERVGVIGICGTSSALFLMRARRQGRELPLRSRRAAGGVQESLSIAPKALRRGPAPGLVWDKPRRVCRLRCIRRPSFGCSKGKKNERHLFVSIRDLIAARVKRGYRSLRDREGRGGRGRSGWRLFRVLPFASSFCGTGIQADIPFFEEILGLSRLKRAGARV